MVEQIQLLILKGALGLLSALVCRWAAGATNEDAAASAVTAGINGCGKFRYDMVAGEEHYRSFFGRFEFTKVITCLNGTGVSLVNCEDCANMVVSFSNLLGCSLYSSLVSDVPRKRIGEPDNLGFLTNPIVPIGRTAFEEPAWGSGFKYHEVAWNGNATDGDKVFDACLKPRQCPSDAGSDAVGAWDIVFCDGTCSEPFSYRELLAAPGVAGYDRCLSHPNDKRRAVIK